MERHKATQSHANGTTMGRFPRLTPVRLSPQVPDHMTVSACVSGLCAAHIAPHGDWVVFSTGVITSWFLAARPGSQLLLIPVQPFLLRSVGAN